MKDRNGTEIELGATVVLIDYVGHGVVTEIDEDKDTIKTRLPNGSVQESSSGVEKFGFAIVQVNKADITV